MSGDDVIGSIGARFRRLGCAVSLDVRDLATGAEVAIEADRPMVAASTFKALVALACFRDIHLGRLDGAESIEVDPGRATPGPTGLSLLHYPARISLRDLVGLMMAVSDNAATDLVLGRVGLERVNALATSQGCGDTVVVSDLAKLLDGVGRDLGFADYRTLVSAQAGELGEEARARSVDQARIAGCAALDPTRTTRTTAGDMVRFLAGVWSDADDPTWHRELRTLMSRQVTRRLEPAVPDGGTLAAKSGGLFGRVRNEIGVIGYPDGGRYAAAIFTQAAEAFVNTAAINMAMAEAVGSAIVTLRARG